MINWGALKMQDQKMQELENKGTSTRREALIKKV